MGGCRIAPIGLNQQTTSHRLTRSDAHQLSCSLSDASSGDRFQVMAAFRFLEKVEDETRQMHPRLARGIDSTDQDRKVPVGPNQNRTIVGPSWANTIPTPYQCQGTLSPVQHSGYQHDSNVLPTLGRRFESYRGNRPVVGENRRESRHFSHISPRYPHLPHSTNRFAPTTKPASYPELAAFLLRGSLIDILHYDDLVGSTS